MKIPASSVVCPTDVSRIGNLAVPVAYRLCADGGTVHLLHVCEPPYLGNPLYGPYVQGYVPTPEDTQKGEQAILDQIKRLTPPEALARGIRTQVHMVHGIEVARLIVEQAGALGADAIVLGTRGRTGLGRILMGSVATDVVKQQSVPVVLVHHDLKESR